MRYSVYAPERSKNMSWNFPCLFTFEAYDDDAARAVCVAEAALVNTYRHKTCRFISGGINWILVSVLCRFGEPHNILWGSLPKLKK